MSKYTTGEIAKLCAVSVRTVQYYDTRGILVPTELTEGGRRLYSDDDLNKMKIICFLRELELPIDSIKKLFEEEQPEKVISILLDEQEKLLRNEIAEKQKRAAVIAETRRTLRQMSCVSVESIGDIAHIMENKIKLRRVHMIMLVVGLIMDAIEAAAFMLGILKGIWLPFVIGMIVVLIMAVWVTNFYWKNTVYVCPQCHALFRANYRETLFARHTINTRRLTCTNCGHHGFCVETYGKK